MTQLKEEAKRAVAAALSDFEGDLLLAVDKLQEQWQQELSGVKANARSLLATVLQERESLRTSLSTAANLWHILKPAEADDTHHEGSVKVAAQSSGFLANNDQIATVKALQNVSHTIFFLEFINVAPEALDRAMKSLANLSDDGLNRVVPGNAAMLVDAHGVLTAAERLRNLILLESPEMEDGDLLLPWFSVVDDTRLALDRIVLKDIFSDVVRISQQNPRLLVAAARIVESEEAEDLWWQKHLERCGRLEHGTILQPYNPKGYRRRAQEAILGSLKKLFLQKERELGIEKGTETNKYGNEKAADVESVEMADVLEWIEHRRAENETVRRFVAPCLPPSFLISDLYEKELHRQFMRLITGLLHLVYPDGSMMLSEEDLMMLTTWYCRYKEVVGDYDEAMDSFLSAEDRKRLISALQKHCASRILSKIAVAISADKRKADVELSEQNLVLHSVHKSFVQKSESGPETSDLPDAVLGCINEEVRRMLALKIQGVDQAIAETAADCLLAFQEEIRQILEDEAKTSSEEQFRLYACATANNMARCLEYSEDLRDLFIPLASDRDRSDIEERMERVVEGFRASASMALKELIKGMDSCLHIHARRLFAPHTGTEIMLDIIATLDDFLREYQKYLLPYHFEHLVIESLKRIVVWYLDPFLRMAQQRVEESAARRFTSLPAFDDTNSVTIDMVAEEGEDNSFTLPAARTTSVRKETVGLRCMNGAAVVAQIDKDKANLVEFMTGKVILYQKKQLHPTLEPVQAIRSLYTCASTTLTLVNTFRDAKAVINRALRPSWVHECGVSGYFNSRVAEMIWENRKDVSPLILLEAVSMIRSLGDTVEPPSPKDAPLLNLEEGCAMESRTCEAEGSFSDRVRSSEGAYPDPATSASSLLWSPSSPTLLTSKRR